MVGVVDEDAIMRVVVAEEHIAPAGAAGDEAGVTP